MPPAKKQKVDIQFPIQGMVEGAAHSRQPPTTTPDAKNVRPFDVEEDRARGGRREGLVKAIDHAVASETRIDFIGEVSTANDVTVTELGGIEVYPGDHPDYPSQEAKLGHVALPEGTQVTEDNIMLGGDGEAQAHTVYCWANTFVKALGSNQSTNVGSQYQEGAGSPIHEGSGDYSNHRRAPRHFSDLANTIKKKDDQGVSYLLLRPSAFSFYTAQSGDIPDDGSPWPASIKTWDQWVDSKSDAELLYIWGSSNDAPDDEIGIHRFISIIPRTEFDDQPWNSELDKEFTTTIRFQPPQAFHTTTQQAYNRIGFVNTAEDASSSYGVVYDPYYTELAGGVGGLHAYEFPDKEEYQGEFENSNTNAWGMVFRIKVKNPTTTENWYDWCGNAEPTQYENLAFAIWFEKPRFADYESDDETLTRMFIGACGRTEYSYDYFWVFPNTKKLISSNVFEDDNQKIHTLTVHAKGNKFDISVDGTVIKSYDDINDSDLFEGQIAGVENPTNTQSSSCHTSFFYSSRLWVRPVSADTTGARVRSKLKYFGNFDWVHQADSNGDTAGGQTGTGSPQDSTDSLRLYDWTWRTINNISLGTDFILAVADGKIYDAPAVEPGQFAQITPDQALETGTRRVDGVQFFQKVYFVDGRNYKVYDPETREVSDWDADGTATLPGGDGSTGTYGSGTSDENDRATIITNYLGRIVLSGLSSEPQNWFMSAFGDADDWAIDESPAEGGAVSGQGSLLGEISDPITALANSGDRRLVIGCTNSMFAITGDPADPSTQQVAISRDIGIVGADAWCYGPNRTLFFLGENGLYSIAPNEYDISQVNRISAGKLDKKFGNFDYSSVTPRLVYDHANHGIHIFLTPTSRKTGGQEHFYYDQRTNSFWPMEYPGVTGPTYTWNYQSPNPEVRTIMLGGYDGYIRTFSSTALDDDGTDIDSHVWIGPIQISSTQEVKLTELTAVLDEQTPGLDYEVYAADTVESAKSGTPIFTGSWNSGRNNYVRTRARGASIFIKLLNGTQQAPWALERLAATLAVAGRTRVR